MLKVIDLFANIYSETYNLEAFAVNIEISLKSLTKTDKQINFNYFIRIDRIPYALDKIGNFLKFPR